MMDRVAQEAQEAQAFLRHSDLQAPATQPRAFHVTTIHNYPSFQQRGVYIFT